VAGHGAPHLQDGRPSASPASSEPPLELDRAARAATRTQDRERRRERDKKAKRLEKLEKEIASGERSLEEIGLRLGDPAVYKDGERARALEAERAAAKEAVDALYREWERLAAEVEALDHAPS
jgi:hypothetical protein